MFRKALLIIGACLSSTSLWAQTEKPIEIILEEVGKRSSSYSNGVKVYAINHLDYPVCYEPTLTVNENMETDWVADSVLLAPGVGKVFVGTILVRDFNEDWRFELGGDLTADCF